MFEADSEKYTSVKDGLKAAKTEATLARAAGVLGDSFVASSVSGRWVEGLGTMRVSLGSMLEGHIALCEEGADLAEKASEKIKDDLVPARNAILSELGAAAGSASKVSFDESFDLPSRFLEVDVAADSMQCAAGLASLATCGLPGAEAVTAPLAELSSALTEQSNAFAETSSAFSKYRTAVSDFETNFSSEFPPWCKM